MAKPRIFISSTFYDLRQVRSDIDSFLENIGYQPVRNEEGDIPYGNDQGLEEYCYKEINNIDVFILVIGGKFGSESKKSTYSITQMEYKEAIRLSKQAYIFIEKNVLAEYETFLLNKDRELKYKYVDDKRIYQFIEEIKSFNSNNNIKGFETAAEIARYLKEQFAGLFQRFLQEQSRVQEINIIKDLEKVSGTLNTLVNYLSEQNKDKSDEMQKILLINHPLIDSLSSALSIPYNFYIESYSDMEKLIEARGYRYQEVIKNEDGMNFHKWTKSSKSKINVLFVCTAIFDSDLNLRYYRRNEWITDFVNHFEEKLVEDIDGLPF